MAKTRLRVEASESAGRITRSLERDVNLYKRSLKLTMWRALSILEAAILIEMQRQFKTRSGFFRNSIPNSKTVDEVDGIVVGSIGPVGVVYAAIHEFGGKTRPHIIRPRFKKALAWSGSSGQYSTLSQMRTNRVGSGEGASRGQFMTMRRIKTNKVKIFAKEVHHPGSNIPARPYMRPALLKNREKIAERFGLMLEATFKWEGE